MPKSVTRVEYSIKFDGADLDRKTAGELLTEFIHRVYRYNPFFKVTDVDTRFYEYYQKGHLNVGLTWRFFFSESLFRLLGGSLGNDETGA